MVFGKALLLIVDAQRGLMNEHTVGAVPAINKLAAKWQEQGWPIVCSRFINLPGSNWERLRDWHEVRSEPDTLLTEGLRLDTPYIFKKSTYSAWSNEVIAVCMQAQIRDVVLCGVDTNECVLATALGIFDDGFTPWLVSDACASTGGTKPHEMALELLRPLLGEQQVITSQEVLN